MSELTKAAKLSQEMIIERCGHGIILKPPSIELENKLTIRDVMALPMCVYFLNQRSQNCALNLISSELVGWSSQSTAIGKSLLDIWPDNQAIHMLKNDESVVSTAKLKIVEEDVFHENIAGLQSLTFKFPWFDADNNILGIFGCSIIPDFYPHYSLGNSLAILAKTQLLNSPSPPPATPLSNENYFTKREIDVLKLLRRAKTSREIATHLGLSPRTVEHYIENAKRKIGVSSKSELVDKIIDSF